MMTLAPSRSGVPAPQPNPAASKGVFAARQPGMPMQPQPMGPAPDVDAMASQLRAQSQQQAAGVRGPASAYAAGPQMQGNPDPRLGAPMGQATSLPQPGPAAPLQPRPFEGNMPRPGMPMKGGGKSAQAPIGAPGVQPKGGKSGGAAGPYQARM